MTLSTLIRKRDTGNLATAIPAISATQPKWEAATVARIATVAVANPKEEKTAPPAKVSPGDTVTASLTSGDEKAIRAWLAHIGEADQEIIDDVLDQCQQDEGARGYFIVAASTEYILQHIDIINYYKTDFLELPP